jgi:cell division protein FtsW (lipid II flippase)
VLALEGVHRSSGGQPAVWAALYLTVVGVAVTAMSLLRPDRRGLAWAGGALLAAASWVRLWDLGVSAPEAYTLPSAVVLVLVGLDRLRRDRSSRTLGTLGPGLSVALVPSLLWALDQPTGLRPLLLGIGCLLLVMAGARTGWTAPLALGAAVGALLVLRLAAPYVGDAVPRWVLIGGAGAVLIAVGATWERRLHEARSMLGYVRALR